MFKKLLSTFVMIIISLVQLNAKEEIIKDVVVPISDRIEIIDGVMYQNQPFINRYTWQEAKDYCSDLVLNGYNNWRLPTRIELSKLSNIELYHYDNYTNWNRWFNKNKYKQLKNSKGYYHFVHLDFLENMPENSWFWTSEEKDLSHVWRIGFERGGDGWYEKLDLSYVLCVK